MADRPATHQQFERSDIQPQIQKRAVELQPFRVIVSVLFCGSLLGVAGTLMAIPRRRPRPGGD